MRDSEFLQHLEDALKKKGNKEIAVQILKNALTYNHELRWELQVSESDINNITIDDVKKMIDYVKRQSGIYSTRKPKWRSKKR